MDFKTGCKIKFTNMEMMYSLLKEVVHYNSVKFNVMADISLFAILSIKSFDLLHLYSTIHSKYSSLFLFFRLNRYSYYCYLLHFF